MISLVGVSKRYGRRGEIVALDDVSLDIAEGHFLLLTGPSGAGKTTLLRLLHAAEMPDAGRVLVFERDTRKLRRASIPYLRRNIGVVFQDFKLLPDRSALDNVAIALEIRALGRREIRERAARALTSVGLGDRLDARPRRLSAGEQQRVAVARALVGEPPVLLADEPTGNLDAALTQDLLRLFASVHAAGTTVVLATHDLDVVAFGMLAGWRRLHLDRGRVVELTDQQSEPGPNLVAFPVTARLWGAS